MDLKTFLELLSKREPVREPAMISSVPEGELPPQEVAVMPEQNWALGNEDSQKYGAFNKLRQLINKR